MRRSRHPFGAMVLGVCRDGEPTFPAFAVRIRMAVKQEKRV
jgi:hypothetical protein